jgi:phosphate transport system substrate-binding protein
MESAKKQTSWLRVLVLLIGGAALGLAIYFSPAFFEKEEKSTAVHLKTGGTSNVYVMMANRWRSDYRKEKGVEVDYDSVGSTNGIKGMIDKNYAIAFTHTPMTEEQKKIAQAKGGEVVQIPVILCAVVPAYNLKQLKDQPPLKFTGDVLAKIFLGRISTWNHPDLQELNKDVKLPDTKIIPVHREDSSGTTFIFADYLSKSSKTWQQEMGEARNELKWPADSVGRPRTTEVAHFLRTTEGAIGYLDLVSVSSGEHSYGAVENQEKTGFIQAKVETITAAARSLVTNLPEDLTFNLTNRPGKDAYPICAGIWAACYRDQPAAQHQQVVAFLEWVTQSGQKPAGNRAYGPLPEELAKRAVLRIKTIKAVN